MVKLGFVPKIFAQFWTQNCWEWPNCSACKLSRSTNLDTPDPWFSADFSGAVFTFEHFQKITHIQQMWFSLHEWNNSFTHAFLVTNDISVADLGEIFAIIIFSKQTKKCHKQRFGDSSRFTPNPCWLMLLLVLRKNSVNQFSCERFFFHSRC